jgi:hypothetical protein
MLGQFIWLDHDFDPFQMRCKALAWPGCTFPIRISGTFVHLGSDCSDAGLDFLEDKSLLLIVDRWRCELFRSPAKAGTIEGFQDLGQSLDALIGICVFRLQICDFALESIGARSPGVGAITATSFATAIEEPGNFRKSRSVGAWIGLTTRRYQSGEVDYDGHISRRGDRHLRGLLYEAASVILTRSSKQSSLRTWGLQLRERIGFKRAAVAVARKLAVIMHTMLKTGEFFNPTAGAAA